MKYYACWRFNFYFYFLQAHWSQVVPGPPPSQWTVGIGRPGPGHVLCILKHGGKQAKQRDYTERQHRNGGRVLQYVWDWSAWTSHEVPSPVLFFAFQDTASTGQWSCFGRYGRRANVWTSFDYFPYIAISNAKRVYKLVITRLLHFSLMFPWKQNVIAESLSAFCGWSFVKTESPQMPLFNACVDRNLVLWTIVIL